jgi:hypothetical protein
MDYNQIARNLLQAGGGVGSVAIAPQQVGYPYAIQPQYVGGPPAMQVANLGQPAVDYTSSPYTNGGLTYLGFGLTEVPAGQTVNIHIDARRPFLPQLLYCPSTVIGLQLVDFQVEGNGLFANPPSQGIPIELVSEVSNIQQIQWMTINPDTGGTFVIRNPTGGALNFSGAFWGTNIQRMR